ncbi:MAG: Asp-tRNA(Asn)/Glu-tRNA(Gln) amidotransferase subunit GatB [Bacilli bacterium]|jgi:aspartyl-tRNA(Asn)/glutamyl-tRNA(Gln) amidotransferase subunit B|nr:Asp-tRNA(Asn)/Glu-tRNA(Gln) amidotransferase subunit GatB [Bacilli bacterium]
MNFEPVIGIEIHVELKTDSKMFSAAPCSFGKLPNSQTVPYDLGCPGTMPVVNKGAIVDGVRIAHALHMQIEKLVQFDRKNYFYTDLPKGYQITQQEHPIGRDGYLDVETADGTVHHVRIERAHLEEDTAKQLHLGDMTLVDYNRCGTPLVEIVSMPDIRSAEVAMKYVEAIREIVTFLDVSDGKMEEGSLRCDVNISIRPYGSEVFGTKCEIKNLNSIANVRSALEYEIKRQSEIILAGGKVQQETRRYDESKKQTSLMRVKSNAIDYKYFREPNIVPIQLSDGFVEQAIKTMHKLPSVYKEELMQKGLTSKEAEVLLASREMVDYFDDVSALGLKDIKTLWNYLMGEIAAYMNKEMITLNDLKFTKANLKDFCNLVSEGKINSKQAKDVISLMLEKGEDPLKIVKELGLEQVSDEGAIEKIVDEVLKENQQSVADFKAGHDRALGYIVGQVMKASKGKANPSMAKEMILKKIGQ